MLSLVDGQKVFVYFNLHKKNFSIKDMVTKRVVAHTDYVALSDCEFKVYESGRQRVLREKQKNVHAGIIGYYIQSELPTDSMSEVTYNPYLYDSFVLKDNPSMKLKMADLVILDNKKVFISN